jgi:hypothetical protein
MLSHAFVTTSRAPVVTRGGDRRELGAPTETGELIGVKKNESDAKES